MSTDVLLNVASAAGLFHTRDGAAFADLIVDGHRETWPLRTKRFHAWLCSNITTHLECTYTVGG
jgi:hypothetical protein